MYIPNIRAVRYAKQELLELKEGIDESSVIVGDFNTFSIIGKRTKQKISSDIE